MSRHLEAGTNFEKIFFLNFLKIFSKMIAGPKKRQKTPCGVRALPNSNPNVFLLLPLLIRFSKDKNEVALIEACNTFRDGQN